jgi:hypothetical protein
MMDANGCLLSNFERQSSRSNRPQPALEPLSKTRCLTSINLAGTTFSAKRPSRQMPSLSHPLCGAIVTFVGFFYSIFGLISLKSSGRRAVLTINQLMGRRLIFQIPKLHFVGKFYIDQNSLMGAG